MTFQTRSDWGDNRCDECLGLRFNPTEPIKHFPDCSQHPANLYQERRRVKARAGWTADGVTVRVYCACGDAAQATGLCHHCAAEFWDPEHIEGTSFAD